MQTSYNVVNVYVWRCRSCLIRLRGMLRYSPGRVVPVPFHFAVFLIALLCVCALVCATGGDGAALDALRDPRRRLDGAGWPPRGHGRRQP